MSQHPVTAVIAGTDKQFQDFLASVPLSSRINYRRVTRKSEIAGLVFMAIKTVGTARDMDNYESLLFEAQHRMKPA